MADHNITGGHLTVRKRQHGVRISLSVYMDGDLCWHNIDPARVAELPRSVLERMSILEILPPTHKVVIQNVPNIGRHWTYDNGVHYELELDANEAMQCAKLKQETL